MFDVDSGVVDRRVTIAGTVAMVFAGIAVSTGRLVVVPVLGSLDLAVGIALPLAILLGPAAAAGVAVGVVLAAAVQFSTSLWTLLDALGYAGFAFLGVRLWGTLPRVATGTTPTFRTPAQFIEFGAVTAVASVTTATVLAWATTVLWGSPFYAVVVPELGVLLRSTLLVGSGVLVTIGPLIAERRPLQRRPLDRADGAFWGAVVAPGAWLLLGTLLTFAGVGRPFQIVLGSLFLSLVVATYLPRDGTNSVTGQDDPRPSIDP